MFEPSKEDVEKYGMTTWDRFFELTAYAVTALALVGFFLKIVFF
ncbi:MAG: hypothetical protein AAF573_03955 [Bacteroidota bacterium]